MVADADGGWPGLLAAMVEQPYAGLGDLGEVEVFALVEQLKVNQVLGPFAARTRCGMKLLRDLVDQGLAVATTPSRAADGAPVCALHSRPEAVASLHSLHSLA